MPEQRRVIVSVDLGASGAFAWREPDGVRSVAFAVPPVRGEHPGARAWRFHDLVAKVLRQTSADACVYESPGYHVSEANCACRHSLRTVLEMACQAVGVPALPVSPAEWENWAVPREWRPKGRLKRDDWKPLVARAAVELFGAPVGLRQDCYDAICLLCFAERRALWSPGGAEARKEPGSRVQRHAKATGGHSGRGRKSEVLAC